jgi:hypothetical protein
MKVGDLVKGKANPLKQRPFMERGTGSCGVVIKMSRTGHKTHSAEVLWTDGDTGWFDTKLLEVINEQD